MFDAGGALDDARDIIVATTNASLFAYVADGRNGLKVLLVYELLYLWTRILLLFVWLHYRITSYNVCYTKLLRFFGAAELSYDKDWMRFRLSGLYASGDGNPYDSYNFV